MIGLEREEFLLTAAVLDSRFDLKARWHDNDNDDDNANINNSDSDKELERCRPLMIVVQGEIDYDIIKQKNNPLFVPQYYPAYPVSGMKTHLTTEV